MKKFFSLIALAGGLLVSSTLSAQVYEQGGNILHLGVGFGNPYSAKAAAGADVSSTPPIHISFEHGLKDKISIGGLIGYSGSKQTVNIGFGTEYEYKYSYLIIGARGAYHFYNEDKFNAYGGLMLGYNIASAKVTATGPFASFATTPASASGVAIGAFVGGRYAFNDKLMAFGELGYSIAWLSVGIGYKL